MPDVFIAIKDVLRTEGILDSDENPGVKIVLLGQNVDGGCSAGFGSRTNFLGDEDGRFVTSQLKELFNFVFESPAIMFRQIQIVHRRASLVIPVALAQIECAEGVIL